MLTHRIKRGREWALTLTIPGPPIALEKAQEVFRKWCHDIERADLCALWRVEIQKRGQLHWHLIIGERGSESSINEAGQLWMKHIIELGWVSVWYEDRLHGRCDRALVQGVDYHLESMMHASNEIAPGIVDASERFLGSMDDIAIHFRHRMLLPGAHKRCWQLESGGNRGAWLRYIQDHATKRKQEQIVESIGRHWGVIGRAGWEQVQADELCNLCHAEFWSVVRWMQRLATPSVKDDRCPFGRRQGWRVRRGSWGSSVWFSNVETVRRMIEHARYMHGACTVHEPEPVAALERQ